MHRLYSDCLLSLLPNGKMKVRFPIVYKDIEVPIGFEIKLQQNKIAPAQIFYEYLDSIGEVQLANEILIEIGEMLEVDEEMKRDNFCSDFIEKKIKYIRGLCNALRKQFGKQRIQF